MRHFDSQGNEYNGTIKQVNIFPKSTQEYFILKNSRVVVFQFLFWDVRKYVFKKVNILN